MGYNIAYHIAVLERTWYVLSLFIHVRVDDPIRTGSRPLVSNRVIRVGQVCHTTSPISHVHTLGLSGLPSGPHTRDLARNCALRLFRCIRMVRNVDPDAHRDCSSACIVRVRQSHLGPFVDCLVSTLAHTIGLRLPGTKYTCVGQPIF